MNYKKWLFLIVMLGLPIFIFLFLKVFGDNKFDIPYYYQEGNSFEITPCGDSIALPYYLPVLGEIDDVTGSDSQGFIFIYSFVESDSASFSASQNMTSLLARVEREKPVLLISVGNADSMFSVECSNCHFHVVDDLSYQKYCEFLVEGSNSLVLVDAKRRIRGYYNPSELKEIDRLNSELSVLLSNRTDEK